MTDPKKKHVCPSCRASFDDEGNAEFPPKAEPKAEGEAVHVLEPGAKRVHRPLFDESSIQAAFNEEDEDEDEDEDDDDDDDDDDDEEG